MKKIPYLDAKLPEIQKLVEEEMSVFGKTVGKPTLQNFARWLVEDMPKYQGKQLSHATIINWRNHAKPFFTDFFEDMLSVYPITDRRFHFAIRMLAIKKPHVWGFGGLVWNLKPSQMAKAE